MTSTPMIPSNSAGRSAEVSRFSSADRRGAVDTKSAENSPATKVSLSRDAVASLEKVSKIRRTAPSAEPLKSPALRAKGGDGGKTSEAEARAKAERTGKIPIKRTEAEERAKAERTGKAPVARTDSKPQGQPKPDVAAPETRSSKKDLGAELDLTPEEKQVVRELQSRDAEVRGHEQAHVAASGRICRPRGTRGHQACCELWGNLGLLVY